MTMNEGSSTLAQHIQEEHTQEKHVKLHEEMMNIISIEYKLDSLITRIQGTNRPSEVHEKDTRSEVHLLEVLNGGPDYIRGKVNDAHKKIEELEDMLF